MNITQEKTVASELAKLDNQRYNLIRKFHDRISDSLPQLAEELEFADLDNGGDGGPLIEEHLIVCEMMELFDKLKIARAV